MGQGSARTFNIISLIFLILTILAVVFIVSRLMAPPPTPSTVAVQVPTQIVLPSLTPSNTPSRTLPPTFTFTPTNTLTPTSTFTPSPTITASPTITETAGPTDTPSNTPTPSISPTPEPSATPTGPTPTREPTLSPFLYMLRQDQVIFTQNFANTAGCAWQGIGGQVFDINSQGVNGLQIHVFGSDIDRFVISGSNSLYGIGGWEVPVDNKINSQTYYVELLSAAGTVISPRIQVIFPSDCARNLALVNFIQSRPQ